MFSWGSPITGPAEPLQRNLQLAAVEGNAEFRWSRWFRQRVIVCVGKLRSLFGSPLTGGQRSQIEESRANCGHFPVHRADTQIFMKFADQDVRWIKFAMNNRLRK